MTNTPPSPNEDFAARLREARARVGLSQRELADALGISHTQIARYERGVAMPRPGVLVRMADCLSVPLEHLRDGENIQVIEFLNPDGSHFASIALSDWEYGEIENASRLSGVSIEDVIRNILVSGMSADKQKKAK
jgi:transcriptional regulator with XRE-family HTH domain